VWVKEGKKGRLPGDKRPKSREERPHEGAAITRLGGRWSRYRIPYLRRSRSAAQLHVGVTDRYEGLLRVPRIVGGNL
jgi:hypothetical protein